MANSNKDGLANTFLIALAVCLVCSVIVSGMADYLKPIQQLNKELDQKQNILLKIYLPISLIYPVTDILLMTKLF